MIGRRVLVALFWLIFTIPFAALFIVLWFLALIPGTLVAWLLTGEAENAWVICAPLMLLADGLRDWCEEE